MEENQEMDLQEVRKTGNPVIIFLVGLTAGYIATLFPRLITYLSVSDGPVNITFFSEEFFIASSLFAIVVAISMVWLNYGREETTRNLFMTALALPSVLSGAINMSSTTVSGESSVKELADQYEVVENTLQEMTGQFDIPTIQIEFEKLQDVSQGVNFLPFIKTAIAADAKVEEKNEDDSQNISMGIKFDIISREKNHIVVIDEDKDKDLIKSRFEAYVETLLIPDLVLKQYKDNYYILQNIKKTKINALIEVLKFNRNYGLSAKLAKIK